MLTWSARTAPVPSGQPVGAVAAGTSPVGLDATVAEPAVFEAVTRMRRRAPASLAETTYDWVVAPEIAAQFEPSDRPPFDGQRTHWYANAVGPFRHAPWEAVSVDPTRAVPAIAGSPVLRGRAAAAGTSAVGFDAAVAAPSPFEAVTRTRSRAPASAAATTYAEVVAPPMAAQSEPSGLPPDDGQRTHWYANDVGLPFHEPCVARSVDPIAARPEIAGSAVFAGLACGAAEPTPANATSEMTPAAAASSTA